MTYCSAHWLIVLCSVEWNGWHFPPSLHQCFVFFIQMNVSDFSGNLWLDAFNESAAVVLDMEAQQLGEMKEQVSRKRWWRGEQESRNNFLFLSSLAAVKSEQDYNEYVDRALFKSFIFRVRAKIETYNVSGVDSHLGLLCCTASSCCREGWHLVLLVSEFDGSFLYCVCLLQEVCSAFSTAQKDSALRFQLPKHHIWHLQCTQMFVNEIVPVNKSTHYQHFTSIVRLRQNCGNKDT